MHGIALKPAILHRLLRLRSITVPCTGSSPKSGALEYFLPCLCYVFICHMILFPFQLLWLSWLFPSNRPFLSYPCACPFYFFMYSQSITFVCLLFSLFTLRQYRGSSHDVWASIALGFASPSYIVVCKVFQYFSACSASKFAWPDCICWAPRTQFVSVHANCVPSSLRRNCTQAIGAYKATMPLRLQPPHHVVAINY